MQRYQERQESKIEHLPTPYTRIFQHLFKLK